MELIIKGTLIDLDKSDNSEHLVSDLDYIRKIQNELNNIWKNV